MGAVDGVSRRFGRNSHDGAKLRGGMGWRWSGLQKILELRGAREGDLKKWLVPGRGRKRKRGRKEETGL
jgi:hypothetical protein